MYQTQGGRHMRDRNFQCDDRGAGQSMSEKLTALPRTAQIFVRKGLLMNANNALAQKLLRFIMRALEGAARGSGIPPDFLMFALSGRQARGRFLLS